VQPGVHRAGGPEGVAVEVDVADEVPVLGAGVDRELEVRGAAGAAGGPTGAWPAPPPARPRIPRPLLTPHTETQSSAQPPRR
jgi:hypothetical protein